MQSESEVKDDSVEPSEADDRVCCPDDLCTGALDAKGLCGTCGRLFSQYAKNLDTVANDERAEGDADDHDRAPPAVTRVQDLPTAAEVRAIETDDGADSIDRECCPNDLCTGALDREGVCGTCGAKAASA